MTTPGPNSKKRLRTTLSAEDLDRCGRTPSAAKRPLLAAKSNGEINKAGVSTPHHSNRFQNPIFATPRQPLHVESPCSRKRCHSANGQAGTESEGGKQFKATPIDKRIFDPKCAMGIPRSHKKPPTQVKPFSERFEKANQELLERRRKLQESGEQSTPKK